MNDDQQTRAVAGMEEEMSLNVKNESTVEVKNKYEVDPHAPSCTCPDFEYRSNTCKHIMRVWMEVKLGNIDLEDDAGVGDKPDVLQPKFDQVPTALTDREQWVAWEHKPVTDESRSNDWTKVPIDVDGGFGSSTNPDTWSTFDEVAEHFKSYATTVDGVGFVLHEDLDDFIGVDFDDCRDPETGEIDDAVMDFVNIADTYIEVSPSGTGIRMFLEGDVDYNGCEFDLPGDAHAEVYTKARYLTVTGHRLGRGTDSVENDEEFLDILGDFIGGE
jgi:hypothetical protein